MRVSLLQPFRRKTVSLSGFMLFWLIIFASVSSILLSSPPTVKAATCNSTNIIYCGLNTASVQTEIDSLQSAYADDSDGNGNGGVQTALNWAGYTSGIIDGMNTSNTKAGLLYRDGRIVVNGKVINDVSQETWVTTRLGGSGRQSLGEGIYARLSSGNVSDPEAVIVTFDGSGQPIAAVMTGCGNSVKFVRLPAPSAECTSMASPILVDKSKMLYSFVANTKTSNATLTGGSYSFGDGTTTVGTVSGSTLTAQHSYTKPGTYTATATVKFTTSSGGNVTKTCQTSFTVAPPDAPKITITKMVNGAKSLTTNTGKSFSYQLKITNSGNITLTNAAVTDEAPKGIEFLSTDKGTVAGNKLNYTIASLPVGQSVVITITAKAVLYVPNAIVNKACVDTPTVPGAPDACDTANVLVNPPLCVKLDGPVPNGLTYTFVASASYSEGVILTNADFDFGDGKTASGVAASGSTVTTTHTYAREGTYSVLATLRFTSDGKTYTAPSCRASVKPHTAPAPECKPGIPVGDMRCNAPCPYDPTIPATDTERCVAPATASTLPNTGAGNVIALAAVALIGGFLVYRHLLFKKHKKQFLAAENGTSPLPLADPMGTDQPLAGTPLQSKRRTLLRRRQF